MTFTVLLGIEDATLLGEARSLLEEGGEFSIADVAGNAVDVINALGRPEIDVACIHEEIGPLPVLDLVRELGVRYPYVAIVLITREGTAEFLSAAMEAGARAIATLPLSLEELQARVTVAATWSRSVRQHLAGATDPSGGIGGMMVALAGAKGGTGVTTIATQLAFLAAVSAPRHRRVCLVDLDLQAGDVPSYLDISHRRSILDLVDVADEITGRSLEDALYLHPSGLRILLAPHEGEWGEDLSAAAARRILGAIKSRFDLVVVDCGASVTEANAVAVEMADEVLVVATPDVICLRAAKRLVRLWNRLQVRKEEDVRILINRASKASEVQPDLARKVVGSPALHTAIPAHFRSLEVAANTGAPERLEDGPVRRALLALAQELNLGKPRRHESAGRTLRSRLDESGQVAVEFVAVLGLTLVTALVLFQVVMFAYTYLLAAHAANRAAHELSVGPADCGAVYRAARDELPSAWQGGLVVEVNGHALSEASRCQAAGGPTAALVVKLVTPMGVHANAESQKTVNLEGQ